MFLKDTYNNRNSCGDSAHLSIFLHDLLNATLLECNTHWLSVRRLLHTQKCPNYQKNLWCYSRGGNERCIFFSVQAFRSFKYPLSGYILTNMTVMCLSFHLFTFHRKSSVWSEESREEELIFTKPRPQTQAYVMIFFFPQSNKFFFCISLLGYCI